MSFQVVLAIVVILIFGILIWFFSNRADRRRIARFDSRRRLSIDQIWERYYSNGDLSRNVVEKALGVIEGATGVPIGRLRPSDRFSEELAPEHGWEMDDSLAELGWHLKPTETADAAVIETVDDYVRAFSKQCEKRLAPESTSDEAPKRHT